MQSTTGPELASKEVSIDMAKISELLVEVARQDSLQLEAGETPEEWAASMMLTKNPAGRMKKAALVFLEALQTAEGPSVEAIRAQLREFTE